MDAKLKALQSTITSWARDRVGNIKAQINYCRQFLGWIERQQEHRAIADLEKRVKALIKRRFTELSVLEEDPCTGMPN